ncbi:MAG: metallophosphoesterase [Parvularcula sp.]|jgi:hypothetical protein|nr:metallophosphoesterase [Parvularcula sp.]
MYLLHLSDIHFRAREFGNAQDPYASIRENLLQDIKTQSDQRNAAPARILISGDIGYSGKPSEYEFAAQWIDALCDRLDLPHEAVFVIPGNHDVDQMISETLAVRAVRQAVKEEMEGNREQTLLTVLNEEVSRKLLYSPIEAYNDFAARYSCMLTPPDDTVATEYLDLRDGWQLRLLGLNSALLSGRGDTRDHLLVDNASHGIISEPGTITLVMCHHPYEWLRDGNDLRVKLNSVAPLQLFGHEHTIEPELGDTYVRLRAAAINPEIGAGAWEPGYNIIELDVEEANDRWWLAVKAYARVWQRSTPRFRPILTGEDKQFFERKIPLNNPPTVEMRRSALEQAQIIVNSASASAREPVAEMAQELPPPPSMRALTLRFFDLTYPQQSAIIARLGLDDEADANKAASVRFSNALRRAKHRGMQTVLSQAITEQEAERR